MQENVIREVDEDLRRDRVMMLWRRYGRFAIAAVVAFVLGVAGVEIWSNYERGAREASAERFEQITALAGTDPGSAVQSFETLAADGASGYATLARLRAASVLASQGQADEAVRELRRLQVETDDPAYRDLAAILEVYHQLSDGATPADPGALTSKLTPLAAEGQPWRHSARELLALIALESGDVVAARDYVDALIADPETPQAARARAAEFLAALGQG